MNRSLRKYSGLAALGVLLGTVAPAAVAAGIDEFRLARAIPTDVYMVACSRTHSGQEFLNRQYERVWAELEAVRLDRDLKRLFKSLASKSGQTSEEFDKLWQQMVDLCTSVEWRSLAAREFGFCIRMGFPAAEFAVLMLPAEGKTSEGFEALTGMARTLVELAPGVFDFQTSEDGGNVVHRINLALAPLPLGFTLARHGDILLMGFGSTLLEQIWTHLEDQTDGNLVSSERFQKALQEVGPPEDGFFYVDAARLFTQLRSTIDQAFAMASNSMPAEGTPEYEELRLVKTLPSKLLDACDLFEFAVSTSSTQGMKTTSQTAALLKEDARSRALYPALFSNAGFKEPLKYIPKTAGDFSVSSGLNIAALYKAVIDFLKANIPGGEDVTARLEEFRQQTGFDLDKDILGWMEGRFMYFSVPGPTPYSSGEFVMMISVSDEAAARRLLDRIVEMVQPMIAADGQSPPMVTIKNVEIEGTEGFRSIIVPTLAIFGLTSPTVGVHDGWLTIGSSEEIIRRSLEVAAGRQENFSANERFQKEGLQPVGEVTGLSFEDLSRRGEQLGQFLGMVPMIGMMAPDLAKEPAAAAAISMIGKLGRVVRKLDFFQSSASMSTFDGKFYRETTLVTYREPPASPTGPATREAEAQSEPGSGEG